MTTMRLATPQDLTAIETSVLAAYGHHVSRIGRLPGPMRDIDDHHYARYQRYGYVETHRATERGLKRVYLRKSLAQ